MDVLARGLAARAAAALQSSQAPADAYRGGFCLFAEGYRAGQYAARDASGQMADAVPGNLTNPSQATYASAPGYINFPGNVATQPFVIPNARVPMDLSTDSMILSFVVNMAAPSGPVFLMGNQVDGVSPGIKLIVSAAGQLQVMVTVGTANAAQAAPPLSIADGQEHRVCLAFDARSGDVHYAVDGNALCVVPALYNATAGGAATRSVSDFCIGGSSVGGTAAYYPAAKLAAAQLLTFKTALPVNLGDIAAKLNANPRRLLTNYDIQAPASRRVFLVAAPGQSNENGSASVPDAARRLGPLLADGVRPKGGGKGSMWPRLAELAAARGTWLMISNVAIGSTSILHDWCGVLRAWVSGLKVDKGTYVLTGGAVYKATAVPGAGTASTVAPAGNAAAQTGADNITWAYVGAPRAQDTPGAIYAPGDALFDPNGYFAEARAAGDAARGYDAKVAYVALGQQDWSLGTTRAEFAQGLINAATYWRQAGYRVLLGVTIYGAPAGFDAWLTSNPAANAATSPATDTAAGVGGWYDALQSFAGDPGVAAGDNARYGLGILPSAATLGIRSHLLAGLEGDGIHGNNPALKARSALLCDAGIRAGLW